MVLVTGGAKSGKSSFAEKFAAKYENVLYIATAMPFDVEMETKIKNHQIRRPKTWETLECFLEVPKALTELPKEYDCILLDCITLWITNLLFHFGGNDPQKIQYELVEEKIFKEVNKLAAYCGQSQIPMVMVTNELGYGLVPEHKLNRHFRDIAGRTNQILAEHAKEVYLVVSGIPMRIKGEQI